MLRPKFIYLLFTCLFVFIGQTYTLNASENVLEITAKNSIQRIRINCTTPTGYVRHLLLGFTPDNSATEGFDYGYDALNVDDFPDDINWMIENQRYVTQSVGAFDKTKSYPIGLFLSNAGEINIELAALENFTEEINVYIFDALENTYTLINNNEFSTYTENGTYTDRYFITFQDPSNENGFFLGVEENQERSLNVFFNKQNKKLHIKTNSNSYFIEEIFIYDNLGRAILNLKENKSHYIVDLNKRSSFYSIHIRSNSKMITKKIAINF